MSVIEEINGRVAIELAEILLICQTCELQISELLKVANCILDKTEFFELIKRYRLFKKNFEVLERLMDEVTDDMTMVQAIAIKSMVKELKKDFDGLIEMLDMSNERIDGDKIDFDGAELIHTLLEIIDFDTIDFDEFQDAISSRFLVINLADEKDSGYDKRYAPLKILNIATFHKKAQAYQYALRSGISKDMILSMY